MSTPLNFLQASVRADELVARQNIGIGTDTQSSELHIKADAPEIRLEDRVGAAASETATRIYADSGNTYIQSGVNFTNGSSSNIVFGSMGNTTEFVNIGAHGIETTGNLFVNNLQFTQTQGLDQILNVSNTTSNIMTLTNTSDDALNVAGGITMGSNLAVNTDDLFVDTQAGNVGIGTTSPEVKLQVEGTSVSTQELVKFATYDVRHHRSDGGFDNLFNYGQDFYDNRDNFLYVQIPAFSGETLYTHSITTYSTSSTIFQAGLRDPNGVKPEPPQNTNYTIHVYSKRVDSLGNITTRGNVGIGITNPTYTLDVAGVSRIGATLHEYDLGTTSTTNHILFAPVNNNGTNNGNNGSRVIGKFMYRRGATTSINRTTELYVHHSQGWTNGIQHYNIDTLYGVRTLRKVTYGGNDYWAFAHENGTALDLAQLYFTGEFYDQTGLLSAPILVEDSELTDITSQTNTIGRIAGNFVVGDTGNVGIGTTGPSQKLTIEGTAVSSQTRINGDGYIGRYYNSEGDKGSSIHFTHNAVLPANYNFVLSNGGIELGRATYRWAQIYSSSSTISTSDRNKKQDITDISSSERKVASKIIPLLKTFRMKDAVAKKGDDARIHTGVIAQDLIAVFDSEGLDAHRYGLFCYDEKWTVDGEHELSEIVYENDGEGGGVENMKRKTGSFANKDTPGAVLDSTIYSIRYEELLCFIASVMVTNEELQAEKAKVTSLETQLTSVLARLDALESA